MVAGQPGKQSACVWVMTPGRSNYRISATPYEASQETAPGPSGVESIAFILTFPHVFLFVLGRNLRCKMCTGKLSRQLYQIVNQLGESCCWREGCSAGSTSEGVRG